MIKYDVTICDSDPKKQVAFKLFSTHRIGTQDEIVHDGVRYHVVQGGNLTVETEDPIQNVDGSRGYVHGMLKGKLIVIERPV